MPEQNSYIISLHEAPEIGAIVRYHRRRSGLSQGELAALAGIGKTSVFDIENGKRTVRLATLMAALRALNIALTLTSPLMVECSQALKTSHDATQREDPA